jgi:hypothetical protein
MRPVKYQFLLWCNAVVFAFYLAGHLFDLFILVPNWKSGSMEEIQVFNTFFHYTNPFDYYKIIMPVSTAFSVICFIVFFRRGNPIQMLLAISLLIDIGIDAVTLHYFIPINEYLFFEQGGELHPDRVMEYVKGWVTADYLRIGLIMIGFYASVAALHYSYPRPRT